ncbi:hypothetical protein GR183_01080 [Stappia sp. GBMRC 2046]|uniref:Extensin-like C-terminal domain-containing protein n=1 Tax=Stappia sediminis TaxID=2692190 RepID=A0A7X3LR00_9HYPH|nr:extensin family protein [Stappia sediminis]MXN63484.1 hypothetical protein [Stappia sediminis]
MFRSKARNLQGKTAGDGFVAFRRPSVAGMMFAAFLAPVTSVVAEQENAGSLETAAMPMAATQASEPPPRGADGQGAAVALPRAKAASRERIGVTFELIDFERKHDGPVCYMNSGERRVLPETLVTDGCGISAPVDVDSFGPGGTVRLAKSVVLDCDFAIAVEAFVANEMSDMTLIQFGQRLVGLEADASSVCPQGDAGASDAEAATGGRAIEFTGFTLADNSEVTVSDNWGKHTPEGNFLMVLQRKGCTRFEEVHAPGEQRHGGDGLRFAAPCEGDNCKGRPCP